MHKVLRFTKYLIATFIFYFEASFLLPEQLFLIENKVLLSTKRHPFVASFFLILSQNTTTSVSSIFIQQRIPAEMRFQIDSRQLNGWKSMGTSSNVPSLSDYTVLFCFFSLSHRYSFITHSASLLCSQAYIPIPLFIYSPSTPRSSSFLHVLVPFSDSPHCLLFLYSLLFFPLIKFFSSDTLFSGFTTVGCMQFHQNANSHHDSLSFSTSVGPGPQHPFMSSPCYRPTNIKNIIPSVQYFFIYNFLQKTMLSELGTLWWVVLFVTISRLLLIYTGTDV